MNFLNSEFTPGCREASPAGIRRSRGPALPLSLVLSLVLFIGCRGTATPEPSDSQSSADTNAETEGEKCRKKLAAAIGRVDPESLSFQANPERAINGLNAWLASCARSELSGMEIGEKTRALVGDSARTTAGRFTANDSTYIRDCLLLRDLTNAVWGRIAADEQNDVSTGKDMGRVVGLFNWICRNVSLVAEDENRVTLGLFDVFLTGRGAVQDRAWIFIEALRQQHIHTAFVVTTAEPPAETGDSLSTASLLIVVGMENGTLLFDPETAVVLKTAGNEKLLPLDALSTHPRWNASRLNVVAQLSAFAPRMLVLQNELAAEDSAVLFVELTGESSDITSAAELIRALGSEIWSPDNLQIWSYPEEQVVSAASRAEEDLQEYDRLMRSFSAPFERTLFPSKTAEEMSTVPEEYTPEQRRAFIEQRLIENWVQMSQTTEEMFGKPSGRLLRARIQQILGNIGTGVIQQLQQIRIAGMQEKLEVPIPEQLQVPGGPKVMSIAFPEVVREVNQSSTGNSLYWTAMCQIDRELYGAAIITLMNYRRQHPDGQWKYPSMINQAVALEAQGRIDDAVALLKEADAADNPERNHVRYRLQALSGGVQATEEAANE